MIYTLSVHTFCRCTANIETAWNWPISQKTGIQVTQSVPVQLETTALEACHTKVVHKMDQNGVWGIRPTIYVCCDILWLINHCYSLLFCFLHRDKKGTTQLAEISQVGPVYSVAFTSQWSNMTYSVEVWMRNGFSDGIDMNWLGNLGIQTMSVKASKQQFDHSASGEVTSKQQRRWSSLPMAVGVPRGWRNWPSWGVFARDIFVVLIRRMITPTMYIFKVADAWQPGAGRHGGKGEECGEMLAHLGAMLARLRAMLARLGR